MQSISYRRFAARTDVIREALNGGDVIEPEDE
jgi:hypothetical protein